MNRLFFTFKNEDKYFAKTTEIDNITKALLTALYPHIKANSSFTFTSISISNQAPNENDGMEYITVGKDNDGVIHITGSESIPYDVCEKIFIENCAGVEYYGVTYDLAKTLNLAFANDGVKYADGKNKQSEVIRNIISDNFDKYNDSINIFREIEKIANEVISTLKKKNDDYGNSYIKNIERFGKQAMLIPMFNKLDRLESLSKKENQNFESFEDSLKDLIGYCLMATEYLKRSK